MNTSILDQTDLEILRLLQKDARLTNKELALKLHKGSSTMFERVSRLKDLGYITGSVTLIDRNKFDELWISFTQVQLNDHSGEALIAFQNEVIRFSEVLECYHTTGAFDFLLKIVVSDMAGYNRLIVEKLAKLKNVGSLQSCFVVNEAKRELAYPLKDRT
ncbi:AsnC family transcriptional regulator [Pedobacter ginsengisoli]|uniref:AsnC family transcriptional regulator n=1 Tax=Pedobacter ginsengisoli TaxID=363852 RepID=A0A2D1U7S1_9SPHI|nr:Lrp/AsnC family transcriptional regulator [Pedobacter ginsengisoli]ATP57655.1 AsnC family transcriptional regulator [Pedobacter ginsengisoli]